MGTGFFGPRRRGLTPLLGTRHQASKVLMLNRKCRRRLLISQARNKHFPHAALKVQIPKHPHLGTQLQWTAGTLSTGEHSRTRYSSVALAMSCLQLSVGRAGNPVGSPQAIVMCYKKVTCCHRKATLRHTLHDLHKPLEIFKSPEMKSPFQSWERGPHCQDHGWLWQCRPQSGHMGQGAFVLGATR